MRKRFLGIPVPIVAIILSVLLIGGGVLAAFLMTKEVPSTVKIIGVDAAEVYMNEACTIPLTDLAFGEIMRGETTDPITFWVVNESDSSGSPFYIALSQSGLDPMLILAEATNGVVPESPLVLPLVTGTDYEDGYWEAGSPATSVLGGIDASVTTIEVASIDGFATSGLLFSEGEVIAYSGLRPYEAEVITPAHWGDTATTSTLAFDMPIGGDCDVVGLLLPSSGTIRIDSEILTYTDVEIRQGVNQRLLGLMDGQEGTTPALHSSGATVTLLEWVEEAIYPEVQAAFLSCQRGAESTTAAAHAAGAAISQASWVGEVGGDIFELSPGETLPVTVLLEAGGEISRGDYPFTTIIIAQDVEF